MGRREGRDPKIFNIACDYAVNGQIVRDRIGDHKIEGISIFHDTKYYGMGAEEIYDKLIEDGNDGSGGDMLDDHIDWEQSDGKDGQPAYSKEELKQIRDEIREATMQAAQAAGCAPHLVLSGRHAMVDPDCLPPEFPANTLVHADLSAFADHLLGDQGVVEVQAR
jgi:hypothetical protein